MQEGKELTECREMIEAVRGKMILIVSQGGDKQGEEK